jgi:hypothetical protein
MNIYSGTFLAGGELLALNMGSSIVLSNKRGETRTLVSGYENIRFLSASIYGEYLAFYSITGESFCLIDLNGKEIWSCWMNSDKAVATGIKFSACDNALACFFHFDGMPGMFFCDIEHDFSTTFGCCGRTIGHDNNLRYFALSDYDRYEYDKLPFREFVATSGSIIKLTPQATSEKLDNGPVILDRKRCIVSQPTVLKERWEGLAIQKDMAGFVIQRERDLFWFSGDSEKPDTIIKNCLPESERYTTHRKILSLSRDNVLIQMIEKAIIVNRDNGVIWTGDNLSSIVLKENRALAQHKDSSIVVVRENGSEEMKYLLTPGAKIDAADIIDDVLYFVDNRRGIQMYELGI